MSGAVTPLVIAPAALTALADAMGDVWLDVIRAAAEGEDLKRGAPKLVRLAEALRPYMPEPWTPESLESGDDL